MTAPRVLILASALDSSPRHVILDRAMTVGEVIAREKVSLDLPTIAVLTDPAGRSAPILRGEWHVRQVTEGYQLSFVPVPGRGSLGSILAAVASIALAVFAPWAAGAIAGMMGLTGTALTIGTSLIGAGIMIAGQFIINRLMPRQSAGPAAETVYTAKASSNRAMPFEPIPELFGRLRYPPPYAARPYAEFDGNDQYLYQLHCLSAGTVNPERWEIGDTLVWTAADGFQGSFAGGDTEIEIIRPGDQVTLFPANVVTAPTVDGQQVPDSPGVLGPFAVNPPGTQITRIACDYVFPLGLVSINKKGNGVSLSRTVYAEYREIDDAGNPVGAWTQLFSQPHTAATRTPQRKTQGGDVPAGRYEVRFGASGTDQSDATSGPPNNLNRVLWAGLRGYVSDFETPADCTLVATKIRATEHLSREASGQYLFTAQRLLPTWSEGGGWTAPTVTRSPAWAAAHMLKSLSLADHEYDLSWLAAYADIWETRGDRFDAIFDRRWQASEALDAILHVGRSYHVRLGSIIGFVRDEPKHVRRMAFTPDTIVKGSVRRHDIWFSEDAPDHLEVVYLDGEAWQERSVMAAIGAVGADKPQQEALFGVTDHDHAWREGIFKAAENAFRRSFRSFQAEREGRMLVRGDPVLLHDPVFDLAAFARLDARAGDVLTIDRDIEIDEEETWHVILRDKRGREWGPCLVDEIDGREITLNAADRAAVTMEHGALSDILPNISREEAAHVALLKGEQRLFNGLVVEARPVGSELWDITLVNDDQRVHAVDETEVIPSPWTPPELLQPVPDRPVVEKVYAFVARGTLGLTLEAGWQPAPGAERYVAEISYDDDAADAPDAANWTPVQDSKATRLSITVMPQPVTVRAAGIGRQQGPWAYAEVVSIPELLLPDEVVDPLVEEVVGSVREGRFFVSQEEARKERDRMLSIATLTVEQDGANVLDKDEWRRALTASAQNITATYDLRITTEVAQLDGKITGVSGRVETLEVVTVPAIVSGLSAIGLVVTNDGGDIVGKGSAITAIEGALTGYTGPSAVANAFSGLSTEVSDLGGDVTSLAASLLLTEATVGKFSASGLFRAEQIATMAGAQSTVAIAASATAGGAMTTAAIVLNALAGGIGEVGVIANRFFVATDTAGTGKSGLFVVDGGVVYIDKARIKDLTAAQVDVNSLIASFLTAPSFVLGSGNIGDLTIGPEKLPLGALRKVETASSGGMVSITALSPTLQQIGSFTIPNPSGGPVHICVAFTVQITTGNFLSLVIKRGGDTIMGVNGNNDLTNSTQTHRGSWIDAPPPGTHTYTVEVTKSDGGSASAMFNAVIDYSLR